MSRPNAATSVGIDLGTTYSVVAHLDVYGRPISIPNSAGDVITPSVVFFEDGVPIVGREAVLAAHTQPENVADYVKRDIGNRHFRKLINGEFLPPEVISSYILRKLKVEAERKCGPITAAVVTVPAYFDEPRRKATIDAGRLAGLDILEVINEPTAAAIAYGYQEGFLNPDGSLGAGQKMQVLVYDLGGGTFDVSIIEIDGDQFRVIATDGDVNLGGKEWDHKLLNIIVGRSREHFREDIRDNATSMQDLQTIVEAGKRTLSELKKASFYVNHLGSRIKVDVTREEFEAATAALVERTRTTTEIVVLQAGLTWKEIDRVLLVGGSTRMPMIRKMLHSLTGKDPDCAASPDEAVAHGAALYADLLARQRGIVAGRNSNFTLHDVNSHSLGIIARSTKTRHHVNRILIPKNSPIPCSVTKTFSLARHDQRDILIQILEGESELPHACTRVGECKIQNLPASLPKGWPIHVRYEYDASGQLRVTVKVKDHSATVDACFVRNSNLSDDDLLLWGQRLKQQSASWNW